MRIVSLLTVLMVTASCASKTALTGVAPITLPQHPKRIAVHEDGMEREAGVEYIDPVTRIEPGMCDDIPNNGGALLTPRSWRAVKYAITEWPRWGDTVQSIVDSYTRASDAPREKQSRGWRGWW